MRSMLSGFSATTIESFTYIEVVMQNPHKKKQIYNAIITIILNLSIILSCDVS
jgi:hypothetical protein